MILTEKQDFLRKSKKSMNTEIFSARVSKPIFLGGTINLNQFLKISVLTNEQVVCLFSALCFFNALT